MQYKFPFFQVLLSLRILTSKLCSITQHNMLRVAKVDLATLSGFS